MDSAKINSQSQLLESDDIPEDELYDEGDYEDLYGLESDDSEDLELRDLEDDDLSLAASVSMSQGNKKEHNGSGDHAKKGESTSKDLALFEPEDGANEDDIGSDEEREILKGIRDEIENKVREEMKDELDGYKQRMKAIESGQIPSADKNEDDADDAKEMDPKLKEAILKMNKLDKILKKKIRKEREVKRDRILLEKRMREEISEMQHGSAHYKEIKTNTERFLALAPPPSHNEGIRIDEEDTEVPPLFQTQIDDNDILWSEGKSRNLAPEDVAELNNGSGSCAGQSSRSGSTRAGTRASRPGGKGKKPSKNFIKRNKELAADADQLVAMTDDEKKRLQDLLTDVDEMPELQDSEQDDTLLEANAFQVSIHPGEGFRPDNIEQKSLSNINNRLRSIMPDESFHSIMGSSDHPKPMSQPPLFSRVGLHIGGEIPERFGERVLYDTKEERELKARLESIEDQLDRFKAQNDSEVDGTTHLTDEQLDNLLDQCARDFSRMSYSNMDTPELSSRSQISSRQSLMENPPKLSEEQLQQLLSEAHFPLSSVLLSLRDDDQKIEEEEGNAETIKAETWKAISEEDVQGKEHALQSISQREKSEENLSQNASENSGGLNSQRGESVQDKSGNNSLVFQSFDSDKSLPNEAGEVGPSDSSVAESLTGATSMQDSARETPVLPRINPQTPSRSSFSAESTSGMSATPTLMNPSSHSVDSSLGEPVRLPDIQSSSFLIQAAQGMNNENKRSTDSLPSRRPLQMVHNDLSESRNSMGSSVDELERSLSTNSRSPIGANPHLIPRPPSKDGPPGRTSSRP
ncbi:fibrous sheath-interacting protein 1 [Aplysia californica]|uniref:Fibrous sheath-interacting protein 1 n=1 Tax=Aplysia californica TaxID=6500 RepID=A0ABM0JGX4_APLCA|nr:fibrous sheath-interacting protein 1 [Aplysia californica]